MASKKEHKAGESVSKLKINNKQVQVESAVCDATGNEISATYATKTSLGSQYTITYVDGVLTFTMKQ